MGEDGVGGLVGRSAEQRDVVEFLEAVEPAALLLCGEAGIGKTALWEYAGDTARQRGWHTLSARAVEAETSLPWVGVTDLLASHRDLVSSLPSPQRNALDVAALRAEPTELMPDERSVGTALLSVMQELAATAPVIIGIDDVAHLDSASAKALQFATRRVSADAAIHLIATARTEPGQQFSALPGGLRTMTIGRISLAALFRLLSDRLGVTFSRPTLVRIHETCGGNPLYGLEIGAALQRTGAAPAPGRPLPVPATLPALLDERLAGMTAPVRRVLAAASATWHLDADVLDDAAVTEAVGAGVLVRTNSGRVRPSHPLLGTAAYAALGAVEQIGLHQQLAAAIADPAERARHLALASPSIDPELASVLDSAADSVAARGAADVAADLARLAVERTAPEDAGFSRRWQRLADFLFKAGDPGGAADAQRRAVETCPPGPARARQLIRLAEFVPEVEGWNAAIPVLNDALDEAGADVVVAAEVHMTLSRVIYEDVALERYHAQRLVELVESMSNPPPLLAIEALTRSAHVFYDGFPLNDETFERAIAIERAHPFRRLSDTAEAAYAALLKYADRLDDAACRFLDLVEQCRVAGDLSSEVYSWSHLPVLELWRGDVAAARHHCDEFVTVAETAALSWSSSVARYTSGIVASYEGQVDKARTLLTEELHAAKDRDDLFDEARVHGAIGFLEWSLRDAKAAEIHLDTWHDQAARVRLGHPGLSRHHLDFVEVLVSVGRVNEAAEFVEALAQRAERSESGYGRAAATTGRAVVAATRGELDSACRYAEDAVAQYSTLPLRFDRARALLVAGYVHRRAKAKLAARTALDEAQAEFGAIGAPLWAERVADELRRVNIRPSSSSELTETEQRVAESAAKGRTNRQVADELFVATKTVEANLAKVYRKLGISSRAELGALFAEGRLG